MCVNSGSMKLFKFVGTVISLFHKLPLCDLDKEVSSFREYMDLTPSCRSPLSYRNQSINLQSKLMDWFLYDRDLRHERVMET